MASAWGISWGSAWADSWGQAVAPPVEIVMDMHDGKAPERTHDYIRKERERREDLRTKLRRASDEVNGVREPEPDLEPVFQRPIIIPPVPQVPRAPDTRAELAALQAELAAHQQQQAAELAMEEEAIEILLLAA